MKRVYLAHALSAPTPAGILANRQSAARWAAWISVTFRVAVSADWIWLSGELEETEGNRAWGLACDKAHIERCDELWLVGPRVSSGMTIEMQHAVACGVRVFDLTGIRFAFDNWRPIDPDPDVMGIRYGGLESAVRGALGEQGWAA